jgi:hypothetical protein
VFELVRQQIFENGYWITFQKMIRGEGSQFMTCDIRINFNSLKVVP